MIDAVGSRIKFIRVGLGLTTDEFGKLFNPAAHRAIVSNWELGKNLPNSKRLCVIAELSNTTVQELLKEDDYINVGYMIKELRDSYHETQQQFADRIGISRTYLNDLENNRKSSSVRTLNLIADKLNMKLDIKFVK